MNDSPVHRLHPMAKLIVAAVYIVAAISFGAQNVSGLVPFLFYPLVMAPLSGTPYRPILKRLLAALPFPLIGAASNLFLMRGTAFLIGGTAVSMGMVSFVTIMLKALLAVAAALILAATTSFTEICHQLAVLKLPKIMCLQLAMTYRYLSVLIAETSAMLTAYTLRAPGQRGVAQRDAGFFLGQAVLRGFDRAERIYQAMKCRGFDGVYYGKKQTFRPSDIAYTVLMTAMIIFLRFFDLSLFLGNIIS